MTFNHLMIDLETLGTAVNSPITQIGAVFFDPNTGEMGKTFHARIDMEEALRFGRASGATLKWWMGQNEGARQTMIGGKHKPEAAFEAFHKFALSNGSGVRPWGNGSSFDISMLEFSFPRIIEKNAPWKFWNVRDCRTIKELAEGIVPFDDKFEGDAHDALADAIHQAKWVSAYWQGLRGIKKVADKDEIVGDLLI